MPHKYKPSPPSDQVEIGAWLEKQLSTLTLPSQPCFTVTAAREVFEAHRAMIDAIPRRLKKDRTAAALPERKRRNQADKRARDRVAREETLAALDELEVMVPEPPRPLGSQMIAMEGRAFRDWLRLDGPRQRQFKPQRQAYFLSRVALLEARRELDGMDPEPAAFALRLATTLGEPVDRRQARQRLKQLLSLEEPGGPWKR